MSHEQIFVNLFTIGENVTIQTLENFISHNSVTLGVALWVTVQCPCMKHIRRLGSRLHLGGTLACLSVEFISDLPKI